MKMKHPVTGNIVDVSKGCTDTMLNRGWTFADEKPIKEIKKESVEKSEDK